MAPSFGTSGLRGLVTELTPELVTAYVQAFLSVCPHGGALYVGRDLRPSSPDIAGQVIAAARAVGIHAVDCGAVPTPALALASMSAGAAAVMVTGSHIPADRNGLKFYVPSGEISKEDEAAISAAYAAKQTPAAGSGTLDQIDATAPYIARYVTAFGTESLNGLTIGVYEHSSVARDIMSDVLTTLGATVVRFGRSEVFIPVDTEAVDPDTRSMLQTLCRDHGLDAIVSTDGDADRPMVTDASGQVIVGDVLGVMTALLLAADTICTPVSSNDMVRRMPEFGSVHLTRIGSPYVIAEMEEVQKNPANHVVGFEANGGFLIGFEATLKGPLPPLMTRDSLLPIIAPLASANLAGKSLADCVADLPPCFTAADRVQEINRDKAAAFLSVLIENDTARETFFAPTGSIKNVDLTDGLRVNFDGGQVVHLRPSGNAPEFRVYAQSQSASDAAELVKTYMARVAAEVL